MKKKSDAVSITSLGKGIKKIKLKHYCKFLRNERVVLHVITVSLEQKRIGKTLRQKIYSCIYKAFKIAGKLLKKLTSFDLFGL